MFTFTNNHPTPLPLYSSTPKKACKGTVFFLYMQIYLQNLCNFALFFVFSPARRGVPSPLAAGRSLPRCAGSLPRRGVLPPLAGGRSLPLRRFLGFVEGRYTPSAPQFRLLKIGLRAKKFNNIIRSLVNFSSRSRRLNFFLRNAPLRPQRGYISHLSLSLA